MRILAEQGSAGLPVNGTEEGKLCINGKGDCRYTAKKRKSPEGALGSALSVGSCSVLSGSTVTTRLRVRLAGLTSAFSLKMGESKNVASDTPKPSAIFFRFRTEILRFPVSTSAKYVRAIPILAENDSWLCPAFCRSSRIRSPIAVVIISLSLATQLI